MGLCKCPKKRVTQHFCFEHRVNVCEFCMVNGHPNCIVQPYLQWLEDSSFKSKCSLCQLNLANEECVRLLCYHIFHLSCLNKYGSSFPTNTAPAGFSCPDCRSSIFANTSSPSPIFAVLKKRLGSAEWARAGLGLPVLNAINNSSNTTSPPSSSAQTATLSPTNPALNDVHSSYPIGNNIKIYASKPDEVTSAENSTVPISVNQLSNYIHLNIDQNNTSAGYSSFLSSARRTNDSHGYEMDSRPLLLDIDEDKYRQKSALERARRYLKNNNFNVRRAFGPRRWITLVAIAFIVITILLYTLIHLGRESAQDDPLLDPRFNPNIHNEEVHGFR